MGGEGTTEDREPVAVGLVARATEDVDGGPDPDLDEPGVLHSRCHPSMGWPPAMQPVHGCVGPWFYGWTLGCRHGWSSLDVFCSGKDVRTTCSIAPEHSMQ